jgi:hypothetical protein
LLITSSVAALFLAFNCPLHIANASSSFHVLHILYVLCKHRLACTPYACH